MEQFVGSDLRNLMSLLNIKEDSISDNEEYEAAQVKVADPSDIGRKESLHKETSKDPYSLLKASQDIWSDDEVMDEEFVEDCARTTPEYEIVYQQDVTTDDVYLQMSDKGPGSNSCESLLVKIKLLNTHSKDDITLKISSNNLVCKTNKYFLELNFPRSSDPEKCSAIWNEECEILTVKLFYGVKSLFDI
ncbi:dynein axonemal assembly factor 6-like [Uloborus diversus]|uniref:dynein axonemal assembly factor 6-like n=1 Tax=Uloborus diversus TaxID=327109 RepID=UPI0024092806|nr:dynein axonemal assembly factor 6-like [Uloborus diversus]